MAINKTEFAYLLKFLKFNLVSGSQEIYEKIYSQHDNYTIRVDFFNEKIDYISGATAKQSIEMRGKNPDGTPVQATRETTSNFAQSENMVVLECVDRLLTKGYEPNSITLEKSWRSGHSSGYLDIYVTKDNEAHMMIECKTFGASYNDEKKKTCKLDNAGQPDGQLWAYADREKSDVKLLCLYASHINNDTLEYVNDIIEFKDEWRNVNSRKQFDKWSDEGKPFKNVGIFENDCTVYNTKCHRVQKLKALTKESSSQIFQSFLEILRHNAISDKANAFNKLLNIFICKIIDEDSPEDERIFWWDENTDTDKFMASLESLYKRGMNDFLHIEITDFSDDDIENILLVSLSTELKNQIKEVFRQQKTERSFEFAFREIYNRETFEENSRIVREIVELIQPYQFRYGHKHQFLGEFFEQLLATSIKQESGQFFTPIRIAKFICSSLPLKEETDKCISTRQGDNVLPKVIDYACGSGHFLTEYMDVQQKYINTIDRTKLSRPQQKTLGDCKNRNDDYKWAAEYVYGIEKDYRLAKTTKLNTFLNGDGDANIINADGLAPFDSYPANSSLYSKDINNGKFSFVVANPPYSVEDFDIAMDTKSRSSFTLWSDKMDDNIECLFIERTAQLLRDGGYAAIVIPDSISFTKDTFFANTRTFLFKNFRIKSVINLTGKCFAKTDVNTKILFLQKRPIKDYKDIKELVNEFFKTGKDFNYAGHTNVVEKYLNTYGEGITFEQYVSFVKDKKIDNSIRYIKRLSDTFNFLISKKIADLIKTKEYKNADDIQKADMESNTKEKTISNIIIDNETSKLEYYLLTFDDEIIIADTLEKKDCEKFTGLSFSERGGKQGTITADDNDLINDNDIWGDDTKLNYYIHKACINEKNIIIPDKLKRHARSANASELFDYLGEFNNIFKADIKKKIVKALNKGFIELRVDEILDSVPVSNKSKYTIDYCEKHKGNVVVYSGATNDDKRPSPVDKADFTGKYIGFTTAGNAGQVFNIDGSFCVSSNFSITKSKDKNNDNRYISLALQQAIDMVKRRGYNSFSWGDVSKLYVQLPVNADGTLNYIEQKRIAYDIYKLDKDISDRNTKIDVLDNDILDEFERRFGNPINNEKHWNTTYLDKRNCMNGLNCTYDDKGYKIKFLSVNDFKNNYCIKNTDLLGDISIAEKVSKDHLLKENDIVFVRSNGNKRLVGRSILIHTGLKDVTFSGFCIRYRNTDAELNTIFLINMLKTKSVREKLFGRGTNITNLNQDILANLCLIKPPISEQKDFVTNIVNVKNKQKDILISEILKLNSDKKLLIKKYFG